jgi:hypothetical protein
MGMDETLQRLIFDVVKGEIVNAPEMNPEGKKLLKESLIKKIGEVSKDVSIEGISLTQRGDKNIYVGFTLYEENLISSEERINYSFQLRVIKGDVAIGKLTNNKTGSETKYNRNI